jgi:hypothetical protein
VNDELERRGEFELRRKFSFYGLRFDDDLREVAAQIDKSFEERENIGVRNQDRRFLWKV